MSGTAREDPQSKRWFDRHPRLALTAVTLLGCLAALLLTELAARVIFPHWAPTRELRVKFFAYSPLLGWEHTPGQRGRFEHPDFTIDVSINSVGIRDDEYPVERTGKRRMLVLGDSFGWGFGVEHAQRFSEILELKYTDWEIINASVSGYGTDQEYLFFKDRMAQFRPDVVLLLFYENDFVNNVNASQYWYYKPRFAVDDGSLELRNTPVPPATFGQRLDRLLLGRTYLGPKIYFAATLAASLPARLVGRSSSTAEGEDHELSVEKYEVTHRLVAAINELCKSKGAQFLVVSVPMTEPERSWITRIAEAEAIPYLPLDPHFQTEYASLSFEHDAHWNQAGHSRAAAAIDDFLLELGIFTAPD